MTIDTDNGAEAPDELPESVNDLPEGAMLTHCLKTIVAQSRHEQSNLPKGFAQRQFDRAVAAGILPADSIVGNPRYVAAELDERMRVQRAEILRARSMQTASAAPPRSNSQTGSFMQRLMTLMAMPSFQGAAVAAMLGIAAVLVVQQYRQTDIENGTTMRGPQVQSVIVPAADREALARRLGDALMGQGVSLSREIADQSIILHVIVTDANREQVARALAGTIDREIAVGNLDIVIVPQQ